MTTAMTTMLPKDLYDSHMHTPLCRYAVGEPEEYAQQAHARGLAGIIFTCHNPITSDYTSGYRMEVGELDQYVEMVDRARQAWDGRVDVRLGLESDYAPGEESWLEDLHGRKSFHYILGSVHPFVVNYKARYFTGDIPAFHRIYFEHLAMAAETGLFDALAHPDLVKNIFPQDWKLELILDDVRRCLDRIARTGTAMELNTSGLNKAYPEMNPSRQILEEMHQRGIPVVLGSDSHEPGRVGDWFAESLQLLREIEYRHVHVYENRQPRRIPIL